MRALALVLGLAGLAAEVQAEPGRLVVLPARGGQGNGEHGHGKHGHGEHGHGEHGHLGTDPDPGQALGAILPAYIRLYSALLKEDGPAIAERGVALSRAAREHGQEDVARLADRIRGQSLHGDRVAFRLLSEGLVPIVWRHPASRASFHVFQCSEAPGLWIQLGSRPQNPYRSDTLRACGHRLDPDHPAAPPSAPASTPGGAGP